MLNCGFHTALTWVQYYFTISNVQSLLLHFPILQESGIILQNFSCQHIQHDKHSNDQQHQLIEFTTSSDPQSIFAIAAKPQRGMVLFFRSSLNSVRSILPANANTSFSTLPGYWCFMSYSYSAHWQVNTRTSSFHGNVLPQLMTARLDPIVLDLHDCSQPRVWWESIEQDCPVRGRGCCSISTSTADVQ